jgi:hypothetical protein
MPVGLYYIIIIELKDWVLQAHSNIPKFYICLSTIHISFWMFQICDIPHVMSVFDTGVNWRKGNLSRLPDKSSSMFPPSVS